MFQADRFPLITVLIVNTSETVCILGNTKMKVHYMAKNLELTSE